MKFQHTESPCGMTLSTISHNRNIITTKKVKSEWTMNKRKGGGGLMPQSHQTFRPVSVVELMGLC